MVFDKKEYMRKWRAANQEKINEYARKYYAANGEKINERNRNQRAANGEKEREYGRNWYAANREKIIKNKRNWYIANREKLSNYYIKHLFTDCSVLSAQDVPPEIIEIKRLHLTLKRLIEKGEDYGREDYGYQQFAGNSG